jgi:hypothetical protein
LGCKNKWVGEVFWAAGTNWLREHSLSCVMVPGRTANILCHVSRVHGAQQSPIPFMTILTS